MGSHGSRKRHDAKSRDNRRSSGKSRRRGSRSSSDSRSRSSSSRSSDSRDRRWRRDRYRDSSRNKPSSRSPHEETKTSFPKIIIKNLQNNIVEDDIKTGCLTFNTVPKGVRIFKNDNENESCAIIEFEDYDQSDRFIDTSMGFLNILGSPYHIRYATSKEEQSFYRKSNLDDNYDSYEDNQKFKIEDSQPCNVLILKGLDVNTTEEEVRSSVFAITPTVVYDVRLIKDKSSITSRGFCFIEMGSTGDATALLNIMRNSNPPFSIGGRRIALGYARNNFGATRPASKPSSVASNAIAAARAAQVSVVPHAVIHPHNAQKGLYAGNAAQQTIPGKPNLKYDSYTGYYIDSITAMYYDPNSNLYYNPYDQKYYNYDENTKDYTPYVYPTGADTSQQSSSTKNEKDKVTSTSSLPTKDAKRIAKDMERWAKKTNTVTTTKAIIQKQQINEVHLKHQKVVDLQNKIEAEESFMNLSTTAKPTEIKEKAMLDETLESDHHVNLQAMACLLCQRKFPSREALTKHVLSSKLHLSNLESVSQIPK